MPLTPGTSLSDPEMSEYELLTSEESDFDSTHVSTTADEYEMIKNNSDYEFIPNLPYKEKCIHHHFEFTDSPNPQPCTAILFTKCKDIIRHDCTRFWPLEKPYTCPYICHFLTDRAETSEEKTLTWICESRRFAWCEDIFLRRLAESSFFSYDKERYFDAHRALYADRLDYRQAWDMFCMFGKGAVDGVLGFIVRHVLMMVFTMVVFGFFTGFSYVLGSKLRWDWPLWAVLRCLVWLYAFVAAYAGVFMMVVAWVLRVGLRRSCG